MADDAPLAPKIDGEILPVAGPADGERLEWIRRPELPGVHVIVIENSRSKLRMFHTTFSMTTIFRAHAEFFCRGERRRCGTGDVVVWEPGDFHRCLRHFGPDERLGGDASTTQAGMVVQPETITALAEEAGVPASRLHIPRMGSIRDPDVFAAQRAFYVAVQGPSTALERQSRFAACVSLLFERVFESRWTPPDKSGATAVRRVRAQMEERYAEDLRLDDLASGVGLTRFQLLRLFKRHTGTTPHQYQIEVRVSRARERLSRGIPPAQVAFDVGFADQSHLTRHFKRGWGVKPGEFLRLGFSASGP